MLATPQTPAPAVDAVTPPAVPALQPEAAPPPSPPPAAVAATEPGPDTAPHEAEPAAARPPTAPPPPARPAARARPEAPRAVARTPSATGAAIAPAGGASGGESTSGASAGGASGAGGVPGATGDSGLRQSYAARLRGWVARHQHYPRAARDLRQEGRATVRFRIDRAGRLVSATVETGTGHAVLDAELLAMLRRATPMPSMPAELPGEGFELVLPVTFAVR
jgi:protein TonB